MPGGFSGSPAARRGLVHRPEALSLPTSPVTPTSYPLSPTMPKPVRHRPDSPKPKRSILKTGGNPTSDTKKQVAYRDGDSDFLMVPRTPNSRLARVTWSGALSKGQIAHVLYDGIEYLSFMGFPGDRTSSGKQFSPGKLVTELPPLEPFVWPTSEYPPFPGTDTYYKRVAGTYREVPSSYIRLASNDYCVVRTWEIPISCQNHVEFIRPVKVKIFNAEGEHINNHLFLIVAQVDGRDTGIGLPDKITLIPTAYTRNIFNYFECGDPSVLERTGISEEILDDLFNLLILEGSLLKQLAPSERLSSQRKATPRHLPVALSSPRAAIAFHAPSSGEIEPHAALSPTAGTEPISGALPISPLRPQLGTVSLSSPPPITRTRLDAATPPILSPVQMPSSPPRSPPIIFMPKPLRPTTAEERQAAARAEPPAAFLALGASAGRHAVKPPAPPTTPKPQSFASRR